MRLSLFATVILAVSLLPTVAYGGISMDEHLSGQGRKAQIKASSLALQVKISKVERTSTIQKSSYLKYDDGGPMIHNKLRKVLAHGKITKVVKNKSASKFNIGDKITLTFWPHHSGPKNPNYKGASAYPPLAGDHLEVIFLNNNFPSPSYLYHLSLPKNFKVALQELNEKTRDTLIIVLSLRKTYPGQYQLHWGEGKNRQRNAIATRFAYIDKKEAMKVYRQIWRLQFFQLKNRYMAKSSGVTTLSVTVGKKTKKVRDRQGTNGVSIISSTLRQVLNRAKKNKK